jgi:myo-inositol 2-dehydrogenase / D-chiro-inositol 1-dehydrogenase
VRIGVVGAGAMGSLHVRLLASAVGGAALVAVADVERERAAALAREVGVGGVHGDGLELIASPDVDAVVIASSPETQEVFVRACLEAGKPVLCEKPLATSAEVGRRLVEAEAAGGRRLIDVGFMRRYDDGYRDLKRRLDAGEIGDPLLVHCVHRNADIPDSFDQRLAITDSVVHEVDVARWLLGEEIAAVSVITGRPTRHAPDGVRDPQIVLLETRGGVVVETGTLALPVPTTIASGFEDRFEQAYRDELEAWVSSAPGGASASDGYAASVVTEACVRAAGTGLRVELD